MLIDKTRINDISAKITDTEMEKAKNFIKKEVKNYCYTNEGCEFSVRILFGGDKKDWNGTTLQCLYEYHYNNGKSKPAKCAAIDVGWLLKQVLEEDDNKYECVGRDTGNLYKQV